MATRSGYYCRVEVLFRHEPIWTTAVVSCENGAMPLPRETIVKGTTIRRLVGGVVFAIVTVALLDWVVAWARGYHLRVDHAWVLLFHLGSIVVIVTPVVMLAAAFSKWRPLRSVRDGAWGAWLALTAALALLIARLWLTASIGSVGYEALAILVLLLLVTWRVQRMDR